jgi:hypothetical protein
VKLFNIAITFKALERELNLPEGVMVVGVSQHPTQNQFVVKIACDEMPDGYMPETFAEIGDAFRKENVKHYQREREEVIKNSIHF